MTRRARIAFARGRYAKKTLESHAWAVHSQSFEICSGASANLLAPLSQLFASGYERVLVFSPHAVVRGDIRGWFDHTASFRAGMGASALVLRKDVDHEALASLACESVEDAVAWAPLDRNEKYVSRRDNAVPFSPLLTWDSSSCPIPAASIISGTAAAAARELPACAYDDDVLKLSRTLRAISGRTSDMK